MQTDFARRLARLSPVLVLLGFACPCYPSDADVSVRNIKLPIVNGKDIRFTHLSSEQGPLRSGANDILQDDQGFLWFGMRNGLKRYDGYRFREYPHNPGNPNSVSGGVIWALFKDRAGKLWIGTATSLDRYDPETDSFTQYRSDPRTSGKLQGPINNIYQDREGTMWIATNHGLVRLDPATWRTVGYQHAPGEASSIGDNFVKATFEEADGTFWVATGAGLDIFDRNTGRVTRHFFQQHEFGPARVCFFQDHASVLWVMSESVNWLEAVDRSANTVTRYSFSEGSSFVQGGHVLHEDADGVLWLGMTTGGLFKLDRDRKQFVHYRNNPSDPDSLSSDQVLTVIEDKEGNTWVGTGDGVDRFTRKAPPFQVYRHESNNANSLTAGAALAIFADSRGVLWVATYEGLNGIDRKTGKYTVYRDAGPYGNRPSGIVRAIAEDHSGFLWLGTYGGIKRFDVRTGQVKSYHHDPADPQGLSDDNVPSLFVDHRDRVWAGTMSGLSVFDPKTEHFRIYKADGENRSTYYVVAEDLHGALWLGTSSGLQRLDPETGQFTTYRSRPGVAGSLSSDSVNAIYIDHSGAVWIGTPSGLNRFDPTTGAFTVYSERDGLPNNNVDGILEDARGNLWLSTNNGLARYDPRAGIFTNYFASDGILRNDFFGPHGGWKSSSGEMFFNTHGGVVAFFPEKVVDRSYTAPVILTDFQLFGKSPPIGGGSPLKRSISFTDSLTLSHTQNVFSLEFSALSYAGQAHNRLRYRLEGLEPAWNETESAHGQVTYATLPRGDYVFRVQGASGPGVWNEEGVALRLHILPPWWGTWWFRGLVVALFWLAVAALYYLRLRNIERQFNMRLDERVGERTRIARELHDTLLQSFHGLMFRLQAVRNKLPGRPEEASQALDGAIHVAKRAIGESRDAIQNLRAEPAAQSNLSQLLTEMGEELAAVDGAYGTPAHFRVTEAGLRRPLSPVLQDELYRIGCELLRNAFQHSCARQIEAEIRYDDHLFCLRICDDGKGIAPEVLEEGGRTGHWGLPGVRERANQVGAQLGFQSRNGVGTEVELIVPGAIAYGAYRGAGFGQRLIRKKPKPSPAGRRS